MYSCISGIYGFMVTCVHMHMCIFVHTRYKHVHMDAHMCLRRYLISLYLCAQYRTAFIHV